MRELPKIMRFGIFNIANLSVLVENLGHHLWNLLVVYK